MLPYENSTTGDKALGEIQKILQRFNCQRFGHMTDWEQGHVLVQFAWNGRNISMPVSYRGYATAWLREHPYSYRMRSTEKEHQAKALEIAKVAVYSMLRDWIKAQITMVETGLLSFDEVWMPHIMLPNGQRVIETVKQTLLLEEKP